MEVLSGIEVRAKTNDKKGPPEKGELIFSKSQHLLTDIFAQRYLNDIFRAALVELEGRASYPKVERTVSQTETPPRIKDES